LENKSCHCIADIADAVSISANGECAVKLTAPIVGLEETKESAWRAIYATDNPTLPTVTLLLSATIIPHVVVRLPSAPIEIVPGGETTIQFDVIANQRVSAADAAQIDVSSGSSNLRVQIITREPLVGPGHRGIVSQKLRCEGIVECPQELVTRARSMYQTVKIVVVDGSGHRFEKGLLWTPLKAMRAQPASVFLNANNQGVFEREIELYADEGFQILSIATTNDLLHCAVASGSDAKRRHVLKCVMGLPREHHAGGVQRGDIVVRTDHKMHPEFQIPFYTVNGDWSK
jgi:hypothetical protein